MTTSESAGTTMPRLDAEFFPDGDWRSILVVNIGHPGDSPWFDRLPRLEYQEAVRHA